MATQPIAEPLISVEEYLNTDYQPDCEYNHGVIEERNLGEFEHAFLQAMLVTLFTNQIVGWGVFALPEQRVQLSAHRFLVPDVTVLRVGTPREPILTRPPLITIEIMSPKDTLRRAQEKAAEYRSFGVENIWVIDPRKRVAHADTGAGFTLVSSGELTVVGTPVLVNIAELFEKLDRF
ncbi:MAG TPA: Uma2 family endonuclease [Acidobacteriaceae bacterium]|jgi:Uma2 family endonuclease|nr:Uma2 family endonuclease [Acidobacteriaceae bacterium]